MSNTVAVSVVVAIIAAIFVWRYSNTTASTEPMYHAPLVLRPNKPESMTGMSFGENMTGLSFDEEGFEGLNEIENEQLFDNKLVGEVKLPSTRPSVLYHSNADFGILNGDDKTSAAHELITEPVVQQVTNYNLARTFKSVNKDTDEAIHDYLASIANVEH